MQTTKTISTVVALDVGDKRVGVAATNTLARLPQPLTTLQNDERFWDNLQKLLSEERADILVVGIPRNLSGQDTTQTGKIRQFIVSLAERVKLPIIEQDEALTSRQAEAELRARGKDFAKGDIDALAAVYILEDYLTTEAASP